MNDTPASGPRQDAYHLPDPKAWYDSEDGRYYDHTSMLLGPGGFECRLGEPEDRCWSRDGKAVVKRLNELHEAALAFQSLATCYRTNARPSEELLRRVVEAANLLRRRA